jgi:putative AlgH/UPF0301 family transcriptional regulator
MVWVFALALLQQIGPAKQRTVGEILSATETSRDPDLAKSVVLLIHSDSNGVMGLILNRPRGNSAYSGGPIPLGQRTLVASGQTGKILDGVYMTSTTKDPRGRTYIGYVGWSPQQLTDEISRGLWRVVPGAAFVVFDSHPETLWKRLSS